MRSMEGEFSALNLLHLMHVGVRSFDTGASLDKEYDVAKPCVGTSHERAARSLFEARPAADRQRIEACR